jgi:hypothetical protein
MQGVSPQLSESAVSNFTNSGFFGNLNPNSFPRGFLNVAIQFLLLALVQHEDASNNMLGMRQRRA